MWFQGVQPSSAQRARTRQPHAGGPGSCPSRGVTLTAELLEELQLSSQTGRPSRLEKLLFPGIPLGTELLTAQQHRNSREPAFRMH